MLIYNDKIYRNLEEQVLKNQDDIEILKNQKGIADLGINIITAEPLADISLLPADYQGEYGDAYLVGTAAPYDLYIWTRSNQEGVPGYWFDWGPLNAPSTVPGPKGEQGETGATGQRGSLWQSKTSNPVVMPTNLDGDQALNTTTGDVYQYNDGTWNYIGNIRGPQGIQGLQGLQGATGEQGPMGPQGPRGDVGGFINIAGILSSTVQLPLPIDIKNLTVAYLIGTAEPYNLWIQIGETSETATWNNMGPLNTATLVTVDGEFQNIWDADTKVDATNTESQIYATDNTGNQTTIPYTSDATPNSIASRDTDGQIHVSSTPLYVDSAVPKKYVDDTEDVLQAQIEANEDQITLIKNTFLPITTQAWRIYATNQNGTQLTLPWGDGTNGTNAGGSVVVRGSNAQIVVPVTPTAANHAASKQYVDSKKNYRANALITGKGRYSIVIQSNLSVSGTTLPPATLISMLQTAGAVSDITYYPVSGYLNDKSKTIIGVYVLATDAIGLVYNDGTLDNYIPGASSIIYTQY